MLLGPQRQHQLDEGPGHEARRQGDDEGVLAGDGRSGGDAVVLRFALLHRDSRRVRREGGVDLVDGGRIQRIGDVVAQRQLQSDHVAGIEVAVAAALGEGHVAEVDGNGVGRPAGGAAAAVVAFPAPPITLLIARHPPESRIGHRHARG